MKKQVGRPRGETHNRDKLLLAARTLFVEKDFSEVSLRDVAAMAGTDAGLIRYYFGSKEELFSTMMRETAQPILEQIAKVNRQQQADGPASFMQTYYSVMSAHPHFPRLVFRLASLDQNNPENKELTRVFEEVIKVDKMNMFDNLQAKGLLRDEVDCQCAHLSFFAMMVFPFIVPDRFLEKLNIQLSPEFLTKLAQQNLQLLQHGIFNHKDTDHDPA